MTGRTKTCAFSGAIGSGHDHNLRPGSAADAEWVRALAREWGVPLSWGRSRAAGGGGEAAARRRRFRFLLRAARRHGADRVVLAHHQGDQAETVLLRLVRGAGARGAAGMPARRGRIVRPLLDVPPEAIEAYARGHGLSWREDPTNRDPAFARNRVRRRVIPELEAVNARAVPHLAGWARRLAADERLLEAAARRWLAEHAEVLPGGAARLPAAALAGLPWPLFARAVDRAYGRARARAARLRRRLARPSSGLDEPWLRRLRALARAEAARGEAASEEAASEEAAPPPAPAAPSPAAPRAAVGPGGVRVRRASGALWLEPPAPPGERGPAPRPLPVPGEAPWPGGVLRATEVTPEEARRLAAALGQRAAYGEVGDRTRPLVVRAPLPEDEFCPFGAGRARRVLAFLKSAGVPAGGRRLWPLVVCGGRVLWVAGLRPAHDFQAPAGATRVLFLEWRPDPPG
ncbi:MAG: tRNA lysidine(34) synthetase TilS [Firmicutes bacterium]|nr:tRNA lysidine(34) synthetase TilS [Bacillota bacterium]